MIRGFDAGSQYHAHRYLGSRPACENGQAGYRFAVWAPRARRVHLAGDFNGWRQDDLPMEKDEQGVWHCFAPVEQFAAYKYAVTDREGYTRLRSDPYAVHWETRPGTASKTYDLSGYEWGDGEWMARRSKSGVRPLNIYEVHAGSWKREADGSFLSYRRLAEELVPYVADMGYTHIELLPLAEHPLDASWGYQQVGYFAPTSRYGTPKDLMYFVDCCHRAGIGVLMDWVPAHFARDEHGLSRFDGLPLYEHPDDRRGDRPEWGTYAFNYSVGCVRSFLLSSAVNWIETYHMDGLRVDAVTAMLHLDFGRSRWLANRDGGNVDGDAVKMFQQLNKYLRANYPGVIIAAEESTAWPGVTHPPREGGLGFTHKWNMGWMHDTLDYMSLPPERRGEQHNKLTFSMMYAFDERYVLPLSHDEVVHGKLSLIGRMPGTYEQKFAQLRAMLAFMYAHPGAKLTFMGGEFGQFIEWDEKRPLDHFLLDYPQHHGMQRFTRALNRVYRSTPALWKRERDWSGFRWLQADDSANSVYAFLRIGGGQTVLVAANFSGNMRDHYRLPMPGPGTITEILGTDLAEFGGTDRYCDGPVTVEHVPFDGSEWSVWVHLPPLSVTYYAYHSRIKEELT